MLGPELHERPCLREISRKDTRGTPLYPEVHGHICVHTVTHTYTHTHCLSLKNIEAYHIAQRVAGHSGLQPTTFIFLYSEKKNQKIELGKRKWSLFTAWPEQTRKNETNLLLSTMSAATVRLQKRMKQRREAGRFV